MSNPFTAFRVSDGWPLCPSCGEDELTSLALALSVAQAFADSRGFMCENCTWTGGLSGELRDQLAIVAGIVTEIDAPAAPDAPVPFTPDPQIDVVPEPAVLDVPIYVEPGGPIPWPDPSA